MLLPASYAAGQALQDIYVPEALSGRFTQKKEIKAAGITLQSEGSFSISKDKGIVWTVEKPISSSIALGPGAQLEGGDIAKQVAAIMQGLLVQDFSLLSKYFDVAHTKTPNGFEVRLKTTDSAIARIFSEIVIKGGRHVQAVTLSNPQGDLTTISFMDIKESA